MNLMAATYRRPRSGEGAGVSISATGADVLSGLVLPPVAVIAGVFAAWRLRCEATRREGAPEVRRFSQVARERSNAHEGRSRIKDPLCCGSSY